MENSQKLDYLLAFHENLSMQIESIKYLTPVQRELLLSRTRNIEDEVEKILSI